MKILFLNPQLGQDHPIAQNLIKKGLTLLMTEDSKEAWQALMFHGRSISLAVVHRESPAGSEQGLDFLLRCKKDPNQSDLPIIVTSDKWGSTDFNAHKMTSEAAQAYLQAPLSVESLLSAIEGVIGTSADSAADSGASTRFDLSVPEAPVQDARPPEPLHLIPKLQFAEFTESTNLGELKDSSNGFVLEEVSDLYQESSDSKAGEGDFHLDAPQLDALEDAPGSENDGSFSPVLTRPDATRTLMALSEPESQEPSEIEEQALYTQFVNLADLPEKPGKPNLPDQKAAHSEPYEAIKLLEPTSNTTHSSASESMEASITSISGEEDRLIEQDMPYLRSQQGARNSSRESGQENYKTNIAIGYHLPLGDAVVPGGAAHSPDLETLKKYLLLREQDVAALSAQLKSARDQVSLIEDLVRQERGKNVELSHVVDEQKRKLDDFERSKAQALEHLQHEVGELRFQLKAKTDKTRSLEVQVREVSEEMERLKDRVRSDIRKIRVREKELENRLEIMKKDSEALIGARENKIIELKRKLDLLEFNMDLLQDQYTREKENSLKIKEKLARALQAVKVAGGLLDAEDDSYRDEAS